MILFFKLLIASDLSLKFNCTQCKLAMYLARRKDKRNSGIYQAVGFSYKVGPRFVLFFVFLYLKLNF